MARVGAKTGKTENKIDMSLDAIIKLQKSEKKKQAKKHILLKKDQQQRTKHTANHNSAKSRSELKNTTKLTNNKAIPQKKQNQSLPSHQRLGLKKEGTINRRTDRRWKHNVKQGRNGAFSKVPITGKKNENVSARNSTKQGYSKRARENLVNSRRQIQRQQHINKTVQGNNQSQQKLKTRRKVPVNKKQISQNENQRGRRKTTNKRYRRRTFEERLHQATENASKLKVIVDNPTAKLRDIHSINTRDLIRMQLSSISAVTGNATLSKPEKPRSQTLGPASDQFQSNPTRVYPLRVSLRNFLAQSPSSLPRQSLPFDLPSRITIPVEKISPTLNERFSSMLADQKDRSRYTLQRHIAEGPIVID